LGDRRLLLSSICFFFLGINLLQGMNPFSKSNELAHIYSFF
jgi:hypothetical protein